MICTSYLGNSYTVRKLKLKRLYILNSNVLIISCPLTKVIAIYNHRTHLESSYKLSCLNLIFFNTMSLITCNSFFYALRNVFDVY